MIDVRGTSTDVAMIQNGLLQLSNSGAVVGGWQTRVKAIYMETSATGGNGYVWVRGDRNYIGPRRIIPLCRASQNISGLQGKIEAKQSRKRLSLRNQITRFFFIRAGFKPIELKAGEREIYKHIEDQSV